MDGLAGKDIVLRQDKKLKNRDEYGRLLRYVELNGNDFGEQILSKGLAKVHGKGFKRRPKYRAAQHEAKVRRKGVWETRRTRARDLIPGKVF
jgi:micrococcal nuclease